MQSATPDLYLNMQQFSDLKLQARRHDAEATRAAAQQFEGLFVQMMLKNMRAAATIDPDQHSSTMDFYTEMYDKQLALLLARQGGIGIADLLQQQLGGDAAKRQATASAEGLKLPQYRLPVQGMNTTSLPLKAMNYQSTNPAVRVHPLAAQAAPADAAASAGAISQALQGQAIEPFTGWRNAQDFVIDLWPHAERAAEKLGVSPQVLVAQSALETGWGRHAMKRPDGGVAFNLFGIKAGRGWAGSSVLQRTLEFRDGAMQQESARFRAYDSVADAFDDYVAFVQSSARYSDALDHGGDDRHYIKGLHRAGYATDPAYASKVLRIMRGQTFNDALAAVDVAGQRFS